MNELRSFTPSGFGSFSGNFNFALLTEGSRPRFSSFLPQCHCSRVFPAVIRHVFGVVGFSDAEIDDELAELVGIAWSFGLLHTAKHRTVSAVFQFQFSPSICQTDA